MNTIEKLLEHIKLQVKSLEVLGFAATPETRAVIAAGEAELRSEPVAWRYLRHTYPAVVYSYHSQQVDYFWPDGDGGYIKGEPLYTREEIK